MKFFAGIGSRQIPASIKLDMAALSHILTSDGYTLRSGNAVGSDQAFAIGVVENRAQIWLPWNDFNTSFQEQYPDHEYRLVSDRCPYGVSDDEAWDSVAKFHPNYDNMESSGQAPFRVFMSFMSRNYRQVRGWGEPDSEFVICWTHDGTDCGGTGQAIRVARYYGIPVFNLYHLTKDEVLKEIEKFNLIN